MHAGRGTAEKTVASLEMGRIVGRITGAHDVLRVVDTAAPERWLDRELHGLFLSVRTPEMENVHRKRVAPWKVLVRYIDRLDPRTAEVLCLRLYQYICAKQGRELPPVGGAA